MSEKVTTEKDKTKKAESLPEGWKRVKLGEIVNIFDSKRIPLDEEYRANIKGEYPYCGATGIIDYINDYIFEGEFVLIAEDGGKFGAFEDTAYIINGKFWVNNHAHIAKGKENFLENRYLKNFINYIDVTTYISGSTREKLNQAILRSILLPLPPLPEQKKIAEILETVDNAIEKTDAIIEKYRRIKKGLMADLLTGKIRLIPYGHSEAEGEEFPLFTSPEAKKFVIGDKTFVAVPNQKWKNSPIGKIPEDWEVRKLGEIGEIIYGERLSEQEYVEDGTSIVYGTTGIIAKTEKYLGVGETIVLPRKGSIDNKFYVESGQKFFVIDTAFYLRFNSKEASNIKFVYYFLYQINLELLNEATGVPSLNRENLKIIFLPLPPLPEQQLIADVLSQVDEVIEKEIQYKEKLERIKKGLMEDLLTGKVRVNNLIKEDIQNDTKIL